jgi:hypothetical protein
MRHISALAPLSEGTRDGGNNRNITTRARLRHGGRLHRWCLLGGECLDVRRGARLGTLRSGCRSNRPLSADNSAPYLVPLFSREGTPKRRFLLGNGGAHLLLARIG